MEELNLRGDEELEKRKSESSRKEMAIATTALFFLIFLAPIAFGLFGFPINFYLGVSVAIHEVGHLIFGVLAGQGSTLHAAGGTLFEYVNPIAAVIIFARNRRGAALAMVFLACLGSIMPYTAGYMEGATDPRGTSYFGALVGQQDDVGPATHDWHVMFMQWGLLGKEGEIAKWFKIVGEALVLVGVIGSVVGFWFLLNYSPASFAELMIVGSLPSALYFGWRMLVPQLLLCMGFLLLALLWIGLKRWGEKRGRKKEIAEKERPTSQPARI